MGVDKNTYEWQWLIQIDKDQYTPYHIPLGEYSIQYSTEKWKVDIVAQPVKNDKSFSRLRASRNEKCSITVTVEFFLPFPDQNVIDLDAVYDNIVEGSGVVIVRPGKEPIPCKVSHKENYTKSAYGITSDFTRLTLEDPLSPKKKPVIWHDDDYTLAILRKTNVYCQSESLGSQGFTSSNKTVPSSQGETIASSQSGSQVSQDFYIDEDPELPGEPIYDDIGADAYEIELDGVYDGLKPGQSINCDW